MRQFEIEKNSATGLKRIKIEVPGNTLDWDEYIMGHRPYKRLRTKMLQIRFICMFRILLKLIINEY